MTEKAPRSCPHSRFGRCVVVVGARPHGREVDSKESRWKSWTGCVTRRRCLDPESVRRVNESSRGAVWKKRKEEYKNKVTALPLPLLFSALGDWVLSFFFFLRREGAINKSRGQGPSFQQVTLHWARGSASVGSLCGIDKPASMQSTEQSDQLLMNQTAAAQKQTVDCNVHNEGLTNNVTF